jgi:hypothetical protein
MRPVEEYPQLLPAFRTRERAIGDTSKLQRVLLFRRPAPALHRLIRYYYQVVTHIAGRTEVQPVPARSPQAIEFTFGAPYEVRRLDRGGTRNAYPIAMIGSQTFRRVELLMHGNIDAFTIVFQPGGVSTLFSVPAEELTNDDFEGEAVLGSGFGELLRRLGDVSSFADRGSAGASDRWQPVFALPLTLQVALEDVGDSSIDSGRLFA